jgi:hypothetical protein
MSIANGMVSKAMQKVVGNQQKDLRAKPQVAMFYGKRVHYKEADERRKRRGEAQQEGPPQQKVDSGLLAFVRPRGNVLIKDFLQKKSDSLVHE